HVITAQNGDDSPDTPEREDNAPLKIVNSPPRKEGESYDVYFDPERHASTRHADGKFIVPEGHYFAMGDNRDNSLDSRYWGYVPRSAIIGRAMFVYWSYDESAPSSSALFPFNFIIDFFRNTRWSRTGTLVK
ncbi:MAG TPA: signal peptidase I, partial [Pyrinomonadaceae bacterium]|nr:signal peptidase I [Pyrinomonadaceae bacterium]